MRLILGVFFIFPMMSCSHTQKISEQDKKFNVFLDKSFDQVADLSPEFLTQLGIKKHYGKLGDYSEAFRVKMQQLSRKKLKELKTFDREALGEQAKLSYDLALEDVEQNLADFKWRHYGYSVTQMYGVHTYLPVFMMTMHRVDNEQDLRDYLSRLEEFHRVFRETIDNMKASEAVGVVPPAFVYPYVISASQNVIRGQPFTSEGDSPLYKDFKAKLTALKIAGAKNSYFVSKAEKALKERVMPAYQELIAFLKEQQTRATQDAGVWKFPKGETYYRNRLERNTTTRLTSDEIHKLGLKEVARIQGEMKELLKKMSYKGTLQSFFKELRTNTKYYFPNTEAGRKAYVDLANGYYKNISERTPEFFRLLPKAPFEIRPVEKFREDSAGVAFYDQPSEDGKRPGVYYVNLKNMRNLPKHEAEAILYHEGAPGHHFQIAIAQELKGIPKFRRFGNYTAYSEGWGLYTETLGGEMGGYKEDLSQFGKLATEILRAARLVVDTGIHSQHWTREKAIQYMADNCPGPAEDQKEEVERYIVMPGQATAYKVGSLKILQLREKAKRELGSKFDIRDFHDVVLGSGPVPLSTLEARVDEYILKKK
ncbi:MAG: DUF885 domain-containing protein [Bdellovibrionaceae bacterium]|nr:DUF885 domain-containing protein [Pseudobdellovibrionaceae bacterium]